MKDNEKQLNTSPEDNRGEKSAPFENDLTSESVAETEAEALIQPETQIAQPVNVQSEGGENPENKTSASFERKKLSKEEALKQFENRKIEAPKKSKWSWVSYVVLIGVIALGIWFIFKDVSDNMGGENAGSFVDVVKGGDWRFALVTLAVLAGIIFCDWFKYVVIMKTTTGKCNFKTSSKVAFLGKYYDNITPFAAGGQPMQIYYLHKKGFSGGVSSAVVLIKYFVNMFCWLLCALLLMACNIGVLSQIADQTWAQVIKIVGWIGLALNLLLPTMIVLFAVLPRFANACTSGLVGLGTKIKIVKDKDKTMGKALNTVNDFRSSIAIMSKKPLNFLALIALCFAEVLLTFAFPYCILRMFSAIGAEQGFGMLIQVMALYAFVQQSVAIIPTPGNSGAMEKVIMEALSAVAGGAVLMWSVITWRMVVYYIYIVIGICLTLYEMFRKIYRKNKAKKLAAQSRQSENLVQSSSEDDEKPLT